MTEDASDPNPDDENRPRTTGSGRDGSDVSEFEEPDSSANPRSERGPTGSGSELNDEKPVYIPEEATGETPMAGPGEQRTDSDEALREPSGAPIRREQLSLENAMFVIVGAIAMVVVILRLFSIAVG